MNTDLYMDGRAKVASYRAMIESLLETGLPAMTHREAWAHQGSDDRYLCVRHDVDHSIEMALHMARIEHSLGVRASYYLLPPGDYDKDENYYGRLEGKRLLQTERMREVAQEIASLGHEIGLHNDFLQLSRKLGRAVPELILEQIAYFRGAGIDVVGSASHGSRFARSHSYVNYEVFAECIRPKSERRAVRFADDTEFELFQLRMADLGLTYEAYNLKRQVYVSDTGSRLFVGSEYYDSVATTMMTDLVGASPKVVALFHPEWWKVLDPANPPAFIAAGTSVVIGAAPAKPAVPAAAAQAPHAEGAATQPPAAAETAGRIRFARPDGKPFRLAIRGDCCSRRAVVMNKDLFPNGVELIINEKSPNACFVDTLQGRGADRARGDEVSDIGAMTGSLKHYYAGQFDRSVLEATDLDLLVIDSYSDMNFERWRHRAEGWSLWVHPKFIRDPEGFRAAFEKVGYASLEEATDAVCAVIDRVRANNPGLPVMFLNQPVEYYPKLEKRMDFYALGARTAQRRPGVYAARPLAKDELVPADVGSCGPGLTLHFDAATYRRMIQDAWNKGLGHHLQEGQPPAGGPQAEAVDAPPAVSAPASHGTGLAGALAPAKAAATAIAKVAAAAMSRVTSSAPVLAAEPAPAAARPAAPAPAAVVPAPRTESPPRPLATASGPAPVPAAPKTTPTPGAVLSEPLPGVHLGYGAGRASCGKGCDAQVDAAFKTYAQYFRHPELDPDAPAPRYTPMLIATSDVADFAAWEAHIKTFGNGARLRQKRKAAGLGYYTKMFAWKTFIPDIHEINHSKATRSGGAMRGSYLRTVEEMGGAPDRAYPVVLPACAEHWSLQFGTFVAEPGRRLGAVEVNERLLAYISLRRCGDVVLYSMIMGHGDYLNQGVLVLLHHDVMRWVSENSEGLAKGLRFVMYGGVQNGGDSLLQFKRQAGFRPHDVWAWRGDAPSHSTLAAQVVEHV